MEKHMYRGLPPPVLYLINLKTNSRDAGAVAAGSSGQWSHGLRGSCDIEIGEDVADTEVRG